jgi:hypothetical protein
MSIIRAPVVIALECAAELRRFLEGAVGSISIYFTTPCAEHLVQPITSEFPLDIRFDSLRRRNVGVSAG